MGTEMELGLLGAPPFYSPNPSPQRSLRHLPKTMLIRIRVERIDAKNHRKPVIADRQYYPAHHGQRLPDDPAWPAPQSRRVQCQCDRLDPGVLFHRLRGRHAVRGPNY